ncbi:MAG: hypothetical protein IKJ43_03220 [Bacilli bacterium]|nr:hypothetical protein [Bacilli bacterium]
MNEKGWGFKDFVLILGIIFFALLVTVVIYKVSFKKDKEVTDPVEPTKNTVQSYTTYDELEGKLKQAATRYQNDHYQGTLDSNENWILSYDMLRKENYLKVKLMDIEDTSKECNGYVIFEKRGVEITYTPYINCAHYKTKGYDSLKEN